MMLADIVLTASIPVTFAVAWKTFADLARSLHAKHALERAVLALAGEDPAARTTLQQAADDPGRLADASTLVERAAEALPERDRQPARRALIQGAQSGSPIYLGDIVRHVNAKLAGHQGAA